MNTVLLLLLTIVSFNLIALPKGPELTIYTEEFPPYNFTHQDKIVGINVEIVKRSCESAGISCQFQILPWNRALHLTQNNPLSGLISTSRTSKRESLFQWVGPLAYSNTFLYQLVERDDIKASSNKELLQYTVGIPRNDVYEKVLLNLGFENGVNLLEFSYKNEMIRLFAKQKLDLIIGSSLTLPYQMQKAELSTLAVKPVMELIHPDLQGNYLALNLKVPLPIKGLLQQAISDLKTSGEVDKVVKHYRDNPLLPKN